MVIAGAMHVTVLELFLGRLAGGLVILMAAMIGLLSAAAATVVATIRREQAKLGGPRGSH